MAMSKKTFMAAIIIIAFLISLVAGMQAVEVATANPWMGEPVPPSMRVPNKDSPSLEIQSPQNMTYYEKEVLLNLTVTKPDSWLTTNVSCYITRINYQLDGQVVTLFDRLDPLTGTNALPSPKQFSTSLKDLAEGQHTLQVNVSAHSRYWTNPAFDFFYEDYPLDVSETVNFRVAEKSSPSPTLYPTSTLAPSPSIPEFPTWTILLVVTAAASFAFLAARNRIRRAPDKT